MLHNKPKQEIQREPRSAGGPQIGELTCGRSPHLSCKHDQIKMGDYMDRQVTLPTWGPQPPCYALIN